MTLVAPAAKTRFSWKPGEDVSFFAASFAAGFVLFYGFII